MVYGESAELVRVLLLPNTIVYHCEVFFLPSTHAPDFCCFGSALDPTAREDWADHMVSLLSAEGELVTLIFPIVEKVRKYFKVATTRVSFRSP